MEGAEVQRLPPVSIPIPWVVLFPSMQSISYDFHSIMYLLILYFCP